MKKHKQCPRELELEKLLDGRLCQESRAALDAHLQTCPNCRKELESLAGLKKDLRLAATLEPPPVNAARVAERVFGGANHHSWRLLTALAGAAVVAALAVWWFSWPSWQPPEPVAPPPEAWYGPRVVQPAPGELLYLGPASRAFLQAKKTKAVLKLESGVVLVRLEGERERGFVVRTANGEVEALGTVFSVEAANRLGTRVEMWRGSVRLRPAGAFEPLRLQAPLCARLEKSGVRPDECSGKLAGLIAEAESLEAGFGGLLAVSEKQAASSVRETELKEQPNVAAPEKDLETDMGAVRKLLARRNFLQADRKLDDLLRREPSDARLYLLRCDSDRLQERLPEALAACRQAASLAREKPQRELALYQQGRLLLALGRPAEAEAVFAGLLEEFPRGLLRQESQYALLECYLAQEKFEAAVQGARAYLEAYPQGTGSEELKKVLQALEEKGWK